MTKDNFLIYGLDERGLNVVLAGGDGFAAAVTSKVRTLYVGDTLEVTPALLEANRDSRGVTWLEWTDQEQLQHWGRVRFGRGEPPLEVLEQVEAKRLERLREERASLLRQNPHLARQTAASARLARLDAAIGASDD